MSYVSTDRRARVLPFRRGLRGLGALPSYHLVGPYGPQGTVAADPSQIDIGTQIAIQVAAGAPTNDNPAGVHTWPEWYAAYQRVTGQALPEVMTLNGMPYAPVRNAGPYPTTFSMFWESIGAGLGWPVTKWSTAVLDNAPLPEGAMTPEQYAALFPQNVGVTIDPAAVARAQELTRAADQVVNAVPQASATPANGVTATAPGTAGGMMSLFTRPWLDGIPNWLLLAAGLGLIFVFGRHRR